MKLEMFLNLFSVIFPLLYLFKPNCRGYKTDIHAIVQLYKMLTYIIIFLHNDRLQTVHDNKQSVIIDIQQCAY